ncbi:DNA binding domain-containing protein, excisionase family [Micromonospora sediminicola]|uniref:DNA binding domain-containing protein, excisionase family n=1 Tax=Micromonospora sediminicola TaxID=946078 RepID=A0A1A9BJ33_9ACTN|nr:helix-turn-helix domain-containing protein [Micromonospora sediminicola]SBT69203.1 DNA binding domain-containing protein, excisionase family [Micromonospora sediminicola]
MEKLCYTPTEAAALLGVGRTKVYELIASGQIVSIRIGRSRRIPAKALRAFVEACQQEAA